ncbi:MAG TPA: ABC transporter ATP-binding protein [Gemmatimonadaceae bacterium]|jgi:ABC-2 type transport system ATP-binding protein
MATPSALAPPSAAAVRPVTVVLDGLSKRFPVRRGWMDMLRHPRRVTYTPVLREVSAQVREGEFFGLLGPNGAGKTTLFKMLATLILPDAGTATIAGYDIVQEAPNVRHVLAPVIADERSLYWRLSASENLELYGALQGLDRAAARERSNELLRIVGLEETNLKMVASFSSGMKQRLLIARALIGAPRVLLLDEPTRSLDPVSARQFRTFLREEIAGRQRCTVLLATHNAEEALELCDRVAVLDRGRLLATGTTAQLSRDIGDERYRLSTRDPHHPGLAALAERGVARDVEGRGTDDEGWFQVEMEIPGGAERAAQVLAFLTEQGLPISRFERVTLSLADLIERIVQRGGGGTEVTTHA